MFVFFSHQLPPDVQSWSKGGATAVACDWPAFRERDGVHSAALAGWPAARLPVGLSDSCHTVIGLPAPCVSAL